MTKRKLKDIRKEMDEIDTKKTGWRKRWFQLEQEELQALKRRYWFLMPLRWVVIWWRKKSK